MKKKKNKEDKEEKKKDKKEVEKKVAEETFEEETEKVLEKEKEKENIKRLAELEEEEKKKVGEEETKKKKGRGKSKKKKGVKFFASAPLIDYLFNEMLTSRFGEVWVLKPVELEGLSKATDEMMLYYAEWLEKYAVQFNFGFWLFMILSPRWQSLRKPKKEEKKEIGKEK